MQNKQTLTSIYKSDRFTRYLIEAFPQELQQLLCNAFMKTDAVYVRVTISVTWM